MSQNDIEESLRHGEQSQMIAEKVINPLVENKKSFIEKSVSKNIPVIVDYVEGQKGLRDLIKTIDNKVDWLTLNRPDYNIEDKLCSSDDLNITQNIKLDQNTSEVLNSCVRYSGLNKSSLIRICMIKELYERKDKLTMSDKYMVEDRWLEIKNKLKTANKRLVNSLALSINEEKIEAKIDRGVEIKNLLHIANAYSEFKDTSGRQVMLNYKEGKRLDAIFKDIVNYVDDKV